MSDDLIERLRRWRQHFGEPVSAGRSNPDNDMIYLLGDAADVLEAKDAEIERLKEECAELRHGVEDQTEEAAYHKEQRAQAERDLVNERRVVTVQSEARVKAERALAEAVKVVESLLLSLSNNSSERVKAARQFVKEHSTNAGQ